MSERHIVRVENIPVMFKVSGAPTVQYIRCGKECNPQNYKPSGQHNKLCRRHSAHKRCHRD